MRYCVLYPKAENVHLVKDVGMIAYKLNKLYGYDSYVACYKNGEYDYINNEVKGLKLDFIEKKHNHFLNILLYLKRNSKKIDVLQIFHITMTSVIYAFFFKLFNKKGIVLLKLDCTEMLLDRIKKTKGINKYMLNFFLKRVDIIGAEQKKIFEELKILLRKHESKLLNIPNGIDFQKDYFQNKLSFENKENIILSVGRIGSSEKRSDILLEAFCSIDKALRKDWKLVFIGNVEEAFKRKFPEISIDNEEDQPNIIFYGAIYDRKKLFEYYSKAKIFCCTSKFESFGIALIEAAAAGDVIVSTKVGIAEEILGAGNGELVENNNIEGVKNSLVRLMSSTELQNYSIITEKLCRENFDWDIIVSKLNKQINYIRGNS